MVIMSRSSLTCKLICTFMLIFLMTDAPILVHAQTCPEVSQMLMPCVTYLATRSSFGHCCTGIRSLNSKAKNTAARRQVCNCLKNLGAQFRMRHRLDFNQVQRLPVMCKVNIGYRITSLNPDCSQVH
ncbi:non-specific lipid-transfer protein 1-like [Durio zibethinus]|uniref:Non-specific lipid-transfer protein n=1 Tax=Durio zibethinus TaxID=66656 RepID=A0A6P6AHS7_DURZI|nr:non-specific lipid-transfer protein 1-like [Durio zibethinus]